MSSGDHFQIHQLDFNNLKSRIAKGQTRGWYNQRGEAMGDRHDWSVQFKYVSGFWSDTDEKGSKDTREDVIDMEKRLPPEVGKKEEEKKIECQHDWNNPDHYKFVTKVVNGINRYHKQCPRCNGISQIVKKREAELAMESIGKALEDIPMVK